MFAQILTHVGILKAIQERVRFARARFGHYDVVDFVAVLIGYAVSGEPTAFYDCARDSWEHKLGQSVDERREERKALVVVRFV